MGLRVYDSGFRVESLGFRVQGLGFGVWALGLSVLGLGSKGWVLAGPPNHFNDKVDLDQEVINEEVSLGLKVTPRYQQRERERAE